LVPAPPPGAAAGLAEFVGVYDHTPATAQEIAAKNGTRAFAIHAGLVDPATAIRSGLLVNPTRGVRGTISISGGRIPIRAEVYKWSSRKTIGRPSLEGAT